MFLFRTFRLAAVDHAARPATCRKPPPALYIESGKEGLPSFPLSRHEKPFTLFGKAASIVVESASIDDRDHATDETALPLAASAAR
jgi:hypothetical protein